MSTKAGQVALLTLLLLQSGHALAQNYSAPLRIQPDKVELPTQLRSPPWTDIRLYGQEATFRITTNNDDGMIVGMGLRRDHYSVQLELAPPVPTNSTDSERVMLPIPAEAPRLQTHKLSLRYRF